MPGSLLTALAVVIFMPLTAQAQSSALQGAWTVTEVSVSTPDTSYTVTSPQPSLYIFLKQHYSVMFVLGSEPRELFSGDEPMLGSLDPTDAEKLAAYDSFIANSGTYELTDSTFTTRPMVAKSPNFMVSGSLTFTYRVEADTLWLTSRVPWEPDTETRTTLVRLE
ncbi:MAG: lipocalin-like domain-containing protein [Gemmatimonadetes bacterium]|nr:lipocalin-like domain-containing protein [Gemmatimonadota bacterium]